MNNGIGYNGGSVTSLVHSTLSMAGLAERLHQHSQASWSISDVCRTVLLATIVSLFLCSFYRDIIISLFLGDKEDNWKKLNYDFRVLDILQKVFF